MASKETLPIDSTNDEPEAAVLVEASHKDGHTGALFVHKDLVQVHQAWFEEEHVGPPEANEKFGDVESWTSYVTRFANTLPELDPFLSWNAHGFRAVMDYHSDQPGRLQWLASMPFIASPEWIAWTTLATGQAVAQAKAVEFLEDHSPDIVEPSAADLLNLLRTLRTTVNKRAEATVRADGTTALSFDGDNGVAARGGTTDLPAEFTIGIPVLKGHVDADGKAVLYSLKVRLRASVDDSARLALRFSIPLAQRTLETVFAERVAHASELLGDGFDILRAAD